MAFSPWQTDSANLLRMATDFSGSLTVAQTIAVVCDVQDQTKRVINNDGEEVTCNGLVFVTPNATIDAVTRTQFRNDPWRLSYSGQTFEVERIEPVKHPASAVLSHYEIYLR